LQLRVALEEMPGDAGTQSDGALERSAAARGASSDAALKV